MSNAKGEKKRKKGERKGNRKRQEKTKSRMLSDKRRWKICWDHSSMETRRGGERERKRVKERERGSGSWDKVK